MARKQRPSHSGIRYELQRLRRRKEADRRCGTNARLSFGRPLETRGKTRVSRESKQELEQLIFKAHLLQQVVGDTTTARLAESIEVDFKVLAETRRVVVAQGLGVTEGLQQRIGLMSGKGTGGERSSESAF